MLGVVQGWSSEVGDDDEVCEVDMDSSCASGSICSSEVHSLRAENQVLKGKVEGLILAVCLCQTAGYFRLRR